MKKKKQRSSIDKDKEVFNVRNRLGSTLPSGRRGEDDKEGKEVASSFALRDMFLSLENEGGEGWIGRGKEVGGGSKESYLIKYGNNIEKIDMNDLCSTYNGKRIQEFSIPKGLERQKQPRLQSSDKQILSIPEHKNNIKESHLVFSKLSQGRYSNGSSDACCNISDEVVVCNDFSFNKKVWKKSLLSGTNGHNSVEMNGSNLDSEERENIVRSKISKNKFFNELSDLDYYDDDGIFCFDDSSSTSSFKDSGERNYRNRLSTDGSEVERTCSILVKDKNSQVYHDGSRAQISYSNDENLFWSGDFQDEDSYIPLFRTQTYEEYNSSDDVWSFYTSSFFSETNDTNDIKDVNSISDKPFFESNFDILNEKGYTTDEDQNFIVKKKNQEKKVEVSDNNFEKGHACFTETNDHILALHNSKTSNSNKKENLNIETVSTNSHSNSGTTPSNTLNKPPILGTWTRDLKRPIGIIDGISTNVINPVAPSCTILSPSNLSPLSIPSLDDILDTSAFVQLSPSNSSSSSAKNYLSDFYRWDKIPIGTFRRHQQRFMNTRDELIKGEWFVLTSKSRRQCSNVPILGTNACHKKKKLKKKRNKNKLKDNIELFEEDKEIGMEHCGLGLGPQLSPLFNGLS
ncbi:hypothetical protein MERGE_000533 [Pneumocystis wakefieldiae]|uniref:Uncharacterized protein n=1 Tax=Pneumocystis wakefieldiae TaxID=38082 RepID=A0A899G497_9ASCO|nr:hypothetical protein MERGE_000533 [Pneumocystis wakefieldiae]